MAPLRRSQLSALITAVCLTVSSTAGAVTYQYLKVVKGLVTVSPTPMLGTFTVPGHTYGDAPFLLTAPSSTSPGAFSFSSSNLAVASVAGSTVTVVGVGTSIIRATQAAIGGYSAQSTTATLAVTAAAAAAWAVTGTPGTAFTSALVGAYAAPDLSIPVTNSGAVSGSFTVPAFTGTNPTDFAATTTCNSVAVGGACAVAVRFLPTATGARSASLQVGSTTLNFTGSGLAASDPYFANVTLLMHMDGAAGGTSFPDVKGNSVTTTGTGIATSSSGVFGQSALFAPGTAGAHLDVSNVTSFGTGDFTVEFWMKPTAGTVELRSMLDNNLGQGETQQWFSLQQNSSNGITLGYNAAQVIVTANSTPLNVWTHVALTRSGTTLRLYANGVSVGSYAIPAANVFGGNTILNIGQQGSGPRYYQGYMDDLRITKGVARYTGAGSFSVPSSSFPNQ